MTERSTEPLERPDDIRRPDGERVDGRPTGGAGPEPEAGISHDEAPTVPPEEAGGTPTTEHGPGGDL